MCQFEFLQPEFFGPTGRQQAEKLALRRLKIPGRVVYASAIAHPMAQQRQQPLSWIAHRIVLELTACLKLGDAACAPIALPLPPAALSELLIDVRADGLICLEVGDRALALWLDAMILPVDPAPDTGLPAPASLDQEELTAAQLFPMQHAHARCCALLQLAQRAGSVTLADLADDRKAATHPEQWRFRVPLVIPWLTPPDHLVLAHPAERQLISALFSMAESLQAQSSPALRSMAGLAIAEAVALAFSQFHRDRPLFAPPASWELRHAQFGLILATQRLLYRWLTSLESVAPSAL